MTSKRRSDIAATHATALEDVAAFNTRCPVGTTGTLLLDSGNKFETTVRHEAYVAHAGYPVAFFTDVSGYYMIDRFTPQPKI